MNNTDFY